MPTFRVCNVLQTPNDWQICSRPQAQNLPSGGLLQMSPVLPQRFQILSNHFHPPDASSSACSRKCVQRKAFLRKHGATHPAKNSANVDNFRTLHDLLTSKTSKNASALSPTTLPNKYYAYLKKKKIKKNPAQFVFTSETRVTS